MHLALIGRPRRLPRPRTDPHRHATAMRSRFARRARGARSLCEHHRSSPSKRDQSGPRCGCHRSRRARAVEDRGGAGRAFHRARVLSQHLVVRHRGASFLPGLEGPACCGNGVAALRPSGPTPGLGRVRRLPRCLGHAVVALVASQRNVRSMRWQRDRRDVAGGAAPGRPGVSSGPASLRRAVFEAVGWALLRGRARFERIAS